jgi:hypothetical protein
MSCNWLYLESRTTPERFCGKPGHPYCPEHQREMDAMAQADKDWDEILASLQAVDDAKREQPRICSVSAKRMYANEGEAKATAAHRIADKKTAPTQLRTYKCLHCGAWHLTSKKE